MGKGKHGLKNALQSQKQRFKAKEKLSHAAQIAEQKNQRSGKKPTPSASQALRVDVKGTGRAVPRRATIPFLPTNRILLIGEGNFSFARALVIDPPPVLQSFPAENLTATAYDSEEECYDKYPDAKEIVTTLKEKGVEVLFGIDAIRLEKTSRLKGRKWDKVVWNFPHAGE
jgi:25S rRNA (uracil2634-N3)-methyltransferase